MSTCCRYICLTSAMSARSSSNCSHARAMCSKYEMYIEKLHLLIVSKWPEIKKILNYWQCYCYYFKIVKKKTDVTLLRTCHRMIVSWNTSNISTLISKTPYSIWWNEFHLSLDVKGLTNSLLRISDAIAERKTRNLKLAKKALLFRGNALNYDIELSLTI